MITDFFASDLHLGHTNIIKYCNRPYSSVEEMNEAIVNNWNAVVAPHDRVWIPGDLAMGKIADSLVYAQMLNGEKHLIPGNHDRCWRHHKGWMKWAQIYSDAGFIIEDDQIAFDRFLVCHFPYDTDERHQTRYAEFCPPRYGRPLIHGHVHTSWKVRGNQINVGIDVWDYTPVPYDVLNAIPLT